MKGSKEIGHLKRGIFRKGLIPMQSEHNSSVGLGSF